MANVKISPNPPIGLPTGSALSGSELVPMDQTISGKTTTIKASVSQIVALAVGGVTSVTGTANEILASPTTGAVVLGFAPNVVIPAPASGIPLTVNSTTGSGENINVSDPTLSGYFATSGAVQMAMRAYSSGAVGFIGTISNHEVVLRTNDVNRLFIDQNGIFTVVAPTASGTAVTINGATAGGNCLDLNTGGSSGTYPQFGTWNSSAANGGYLNWQRSGTTFGYIGNAGALGGTLDYMGIRAESGHGVSLMVNGGTPILQINSAGRTDIGSATSFTGDSCLHVLDGGGAGLRVGYNGTTNNYYDASHHFRTTAAVSLVDIDSTPGLGGIINHGTYQRSTATSGYLDGAYPTVENGSTPGCIFTIGGGSYVPAASSLGNAYGVGFCPDSVNGIASSGAPAASNWGLWVASAGAGRIFLCSDTGVIYSSAAVVPNAGAGNCTYVNVSGMTVGGAGGKITAQSGGSPSGGNAGDIILIY